jgi:glycogen operon protein
MVKAFHRADIEVILGVVYNHTAEGEPMISMGDEVRRTQYGNISAYCQDNETSWFDWTLATRHADAHRFLKLLIERCLLHDLYPEGHSVSLNRLLAAANRTWHGVKLGQPDWTPFSHRVALAQKTGKRSCSCT